MDERGKVRLSMKVVDQETGEDITEKLKAERDAEQPHRLRGSNFLRPQLFRTETGRDAGRAPFLWFASSGEPHFFFLALFFFFFF